MGRPPQLRRDDIVRIRGERWRVRRHAGYDRAAIVDVVGCDRANRAARARFLLPFEALDRLEATTTPRVVGAGRWRHAARQALGNATPSWASLRAATRAKLTLIPFQLEPALALARGDACRFLIADAVGLGKTVQAGLMIAETLERRPDARALIISPAGLREQWRGELHDRFGLDAEVLDAAGVVRAAAQLPAGLNPWSVQPLVITSIDYIKRLEVIRSLETLMWDLVVFDEAHSLAGRSDRAAAAHALGSRARAVVLLTATPHSGDDAAFTRLCRVGDLTGADPLLMFRRSRMDAGMTGSRRVTLLRIRPTPAEAAMHDALLEYSRLVWAQSTESATGARLAMSVLTRRACSSAGSLARSVERRIALLAEPFTEAVSQIDLPFGDAGGDDEEPHASLRWPGLRDPSDERAHLEHVLSLARAATPGETKPAALRRLVSRTREPAIIFTEYRDTLQQLARAMEGIETEILHGGLTWRERSDALRRFTTGSARLLLATDAASEGLNLHHRCRLVVNLELPWTPLRLEQRAGRVDRIGQLRKIHVVHLVARGTCEESTLARLARRVQRAQDALSTSASLDAERLAAESILGNQREHRTDLTPAPTPPGVQTIDLRRLACEEAERIARARRLLERPGSSSNDSRGVIAHVRRRRGTRPPQCFWLFNVAVTTASGDLISELPLSLTGNPRILSPSRQFTRRLLDPQQALLADALSGGRDELIQVLQRSLHRALHLWRQRERDLMDGMRDSHARLSSRFLQRGLFDRRNERLAAAQAASLDEALSRSADHLAYLTSCRQLRVDSCDLLFALVLE